jgi:hypothetical protein
MRASGVRVHVDANEVLRNILTQRAMGAQPPQIQPTPRRAPRATQIQQTLQLAQQAPQIQPTPPQATQAPRAQRSPRVLQAQRDQQTRQARQARLEPYNGDSLNNERLSMWGQDKYMQNHRLFT